MKNFWELNKICSVFTKADFFSSQAVKWRPLPVSDEFVEGEKKNKKTHIAL